MERMLYCIVSRSIFTVCHFCCTGGWFGGKDRFCGQNMCFGFGWDISPISFCGFADIETSIGQAWGNGNGTRPIYVTVTKTHFFFYT